MSTAPIEQPANSGQESRGAQNARAARNANAKPFALLPEAKHIAYAYMWPFRRETNNAEQLPQIHDRFLPFQPNVKEVKLRDVVVSVVDALQRMIVRNRGIYGETRIAYTYGDTVMLACDGHTYPLVYFKLDALNAGDRAIMRGPNARAKGALIAQLLSAVLCQYAVDNARCMKRKNDNNEVVDVSKAVGQQLNAAVSSILEVESVMAAEKLDGDRDKTGLATRRETAFSSHFASIVDKDYASASYGLSYEIDGRTQVLTVKRDNTRQNARNAKNATSTNAESFSVSFDKIPIRLFWPCLVAVMFSTVASKKDLQASTQKAQKLLDALVLYT